MARIIYFLNGTNLNDAGIIVKSAEGLFDIPEPKERVQGDFNNAHGLIIDTAKPKLKERTIKLNCAYNDANVTDVTTLVRNVTNKGALCQLRMHIAGKSPIVWNVLLKKQVTFEKKYHENGAKCLYDFTLEFIEPQPVKIIYQHIHGGTAQLKFNPHGASFDIDWGDGTITYNATGTAQITRQHTYSGTVTAFIMLLGDVDVITNEVIDTNTTKIWTFA